MTNSLLICLQNENIHPDFENWAQSLNTRLAPNHITPRGAWVETDRGVGLAVFNPSECTAVHSTAVCLGNMLYPCENWWKPGGGVPDGSFAIFRSNQNMVEAISDVAATRTIWYTHNERFLAVSTSQRALTAWMGSFQPNPSTLPWMLSSGTLGPDNSWDIRVKPLPGDSVLRLNRLTWDLSIETQPIEFNESGKSQADQLEHFQESLHEIFTRFDLDLSKWILLLSGGYDSRAILMYLEGSKGMRAITWGLERSRQEKFNDAWVVDQLAAKYELQHRYQATKSCKEDFGTIMRRFILAGEGRIDHIGAYLDGLATWKEIFNMGVCGVIRGDVGFPSLPVFHPFDVRQTLGLTFLSDYANLDQFHDWGLAAQSIPQKMERLPEESLLMWRDRLYHNFSLPVIKASLNYIKTPFVEVINPLICRSLIYPYRQMPDEMRDRKWFWKTIISSMNSDIPFAKRSALGFKSDILGSQAATEWLRSEINTKSAPRILPDRLLELLNQKIQEKKSSHSSSLRAWAQRYIPAPIRRRVRSSTGKPTISYNELALRAIIILQMHTLLDDDGDWGRKY